ncbi:carboxypeptidase inhibitor SmCI-like isoform X2 [Erythrolamprus reginae]|uniref:carboxypeptidase inhibitor SmCI-like isoform X2 n=1 Tax=Erythrolamprus reginae TaxID=121349 RepID=UPI00396CD84D
MKAAHGFLLYLGLLILLAEVPPSRGEIGVGPLPSLLPNICSLPMVRGPCVALLERWYYYPELRRCLRFTYGGCGGNANNFMTQRSCERACSPSAPVRPGSCPRPELFPDKHCGEFCSSDDSCPGAQRCCETGCGHQCRLPAGEHPGKCPTMPVLQTFAPCNNTCTNDLECLQEEKCCFDGCGRSCLTPETARPSPPRLPDLPRWVRLEPLPSPSPHAERHLQCQLPAKPGPCQVMQPRYFYSQILGRCRLFLYSGCQGNGNNFRSRRECERICSRRRLDKPDPILE